MSSNPLQDNGVPKWGWFNRIVRAVLLVYCADQAEVDGAGELYRSSPPGLKKLIRREIVRVARDFVGKTKWHNQGSDSAEEFLSRELARRSEQNAALKAEIARLRKIEDALRDDDLIEKAAEWLRERGYTIVDRKDFNSMFDLFLCATRAAVLAAAEKEEEPATVSDGLGTTVSVVCPQCGARNMQVVRPGDIRCSTCEGAAK
ncbi:hypothetical protein HQ520_02610 [bacterium]|nr:hypothetical protein [bacterium]